jgi:ribosomal protein S18 acetylase RimI-like enzyme
VKQQSSALENLKMVDVEIREATPADAEEIAVVRASAVATLREIYRPNQKALAHKQAIAETLTRLVAVWNGRVIGAAEYSFTADRVHFLSLDVHSDYRRRGVAKQLIAELARIGKSGGATRLSTYTVTQTGNPAIFERLGFRVIYEEPSALFESDRFDPVTESYLERPII